MRKWSYILVIEFTIKSCHENIQILLERAEMSDSLIIEFMNETLIKISWIDLLWSNWDDSVCIRDVDICCELTNTVDEREEYLQVKLR